jgi:hypothetical protein
MLLTMKKGCPICLPGPNAAYPAHRGHPGRSKRKRMEKLNCKANNERNYQAKVVSERKLDIMEGRLPRGARLQGQTQQPFSNSTAPPGTASTHGAQNATPSA